MQSGVFMFEDEKEKILDKGIGMKPKSFPRHFLESRRAYFRASFGRGHVSMTRPRAETMQAFSARSIRSLLSSKSNISQIRLS